MGIFSKKKNEDDDAGLPDLPPSSMSPVHGGRGLPAFDEDENEEQGGHVLPSFPDSPTHNKFSQVAIKEAVSDRDEAEFSGELKERRRPRVVEMEEWHHPGHEMSHGEHDYSGGEKAPELDEPEEVKEIAPSTRHKKVVREERGSDIFVKLEKFRSARKSLEEISEKLEEIDDMIKKIREVKLREDQELGKWEKDITHVKGRITEVNENIFEKVE